LLPNPEVVYFFHVADKPYKFAIDFPLEALWLRPIRIRAAQDETERVGNRLAQAGLDLIRDVRQSFAEVVYTKVRMRVALEAVKIRGDIARLAEARFQAGDISAQEVATARIDSAQARQDAARLEYDIALAEERLRNLMGIPADRHPLILHQTTVAATVDFDVDALVDEAIRDRPDLIAIEKQVAAATERLRLSKLNWVRVLGIGDATSGKRTGHEFGPAVRTTMPIFNWNQGNIARAEAELARAERQALTLRNQIILDVRQAHSRLQQAHAEMEILDKIVLPEVEAAIHRAQAAYREGHTSYVVVLETTRQFLDSRVRMEQLKADVRRAKADLERSVGRRLEHSPNEQK
jgi:cobalt-zinc-cadmium efflux system outer membrane protein